jgi:hypothetical protein
MTLEQQKTPQLVVAKPIATPDAVNRLSPALADAILPFLNKSPDACFGLRLPFAPMPAFAHATASKRAKPNEPTWGRHILQDSPAKVVAPNRCETRCVGYNGRSTVRSKTESETTMNNGGDDDDRTRS